MTDGLTDRIAMAKTRYSMSPKTNLLYQ